MDTETAKQKPTTPLPSSSSIIPLHSLAFCSLPSAFRQPFTHSATFPRLTSAADAAPRFPEEPPPLADPGVTTAKAPPPRPTLGAATVAGTSPTLPSLPPLLAMALAKGPAAHHTNTHGHRLLQTKRIEKGSINGDRWRRWRVQQLRDGRVGRG